MARAARHFFIGGRVQGVGFRLFAAEVARREGVVGYVRNLPDGRVEAMAEGAAPAVDRFEQAVREGPRGAYVASVEAASPEPSGAFSEFRVRS